MRGFSFIKKISLLLVASIFLSSCIPERKVNSGLQVKTTEIESNIFLNDNHIGKSPLIERSLKPGIYSLKIIPDDSKYVEYETTINLRPGVLNVVTWKPSTTPELSGGVIYELEKIGTDSSEVSFVTIPDSAIINFANKDREFSPHVFTDLNEGLAEFEANLPSYEAQKHTINVIKGYRMHITIKLAKLRSPQEELEDYEDPIESQSANQTSESSITRNSTASANAIINASSSSKLQIKKTGFFENNIEVLKVRNKPINGEVIDYIPVGSEVEYLELSSDGWIKIWFKNKEGWISKDYAQFNQQD